jgi:NAD(P)-dependent dehydrogenase (short-subunit alcohol dehydrogenase family)
MRRAYLSQGAGRAYAAAMAATSKAVLITGCSSGIGRASALRLARSGWTVYATAREAESLTELAEAGCHTLTLDVTDEASMSAAVESVQRAEGAVGVLVNNAGYSQSGAIETVPMDAVRRQFETNVFGPVRLAQLVLPGMRAQRWGKIVNVGSMGGRLTFPGAGHYHATKHSLEAISDALRFEARGFGIDVILLEPGLITTEFSEAASAAVSDLGDAEGDPYASFNQTVVEITTGTYKGPMRRLGAGPERVASVLERAITRAHPPARITITASAKLSIAASHVRSLSRRRAAMRAQFPQPGR